MTPARWREIEALVQAAFDHPPAGRAAFLNRSCAGDADLQLEVESLLASEDLARGFLEANALEDAAQLLVLHDQDGGPTVRIGRYPVEQRLGAGGMGEVFLAHDVRLGRKIALKVLDRALITDARSRARFLREARLASSLDHPNICTVYEVGESGEHLFIAMQYLEGETLRCRIDGQPLPLDLLFPIARQVTAALATAHARGVVHRDVKGSNIIVTLDGQVKVVDFGLATVFDHGQPGSEVTAVGAVIGTPASMSPEQARGERVDHRSDIFSFGVLLYEMATGSSPFVGRSRADALSALLTAPHTPAIELNRTLPPELSCAIDRALAKSPADRYPSMSELAEDLQCICEDLAARGPSPTTSRRAGPASRLRHRRARSLRGLSARAVLILIAALVTLTLATVGIRQQRGAADAAAGGMKVRSLAVLPFRPVTAGPRNAALEIGMADTLIARLSSIRGIDVRPISAVRNYSGLDQDALAAGRAQRVDAVIDGQVQTSGDRVRVRVRLLRVSDARQLWTEQLDGRLTDIFSLQDDVSARIAATLAVTLSLDETSGITKRHTGDVEAYQLYLLGRYHLNRLTDDGSLKALDYFRQAAAKDPNYALAHAGISDAYFNLSSFNAMPPGEGFPQARAAAETALGLDRGLAEGHVALAGPIFLYDWNWEAAEREYRAALTLNAGASDPHMAYGFYLATMGRTDEALREMERALALDPLSPAKISSLGDVFYLARRYDQAKALHRRALDLDPNFAYAHWALGRTLSATRNYEEATTAIEKAMALSGDSPDETAELARISALAGRRAKAVELFGRLQKLSTNRYVAPTTFALIHAALGDTEAAFAWLDRARSQRDFLLVLASVEPMFDSIRDDPRFDTLLAAMNLR